MTHDPTRPEPIDLSWVTTEKIDTPGPAGVALCVLMVVVLMAGLALFTALVGVAASRIQAPGADACPTQTGREAAAQDGAP